MNIFFIYLNICNVGDYVSVSVFVSVFFFVKKHRHKLATIHKMSLLERREKKKKTFPLSFDTFSNAIGKTQATVHCETTIIIAKL